MDSAFAALFLSVLMHVAWNLMARRSEPDSRFLWWALGAYLVLVGPWSIVALATAASWSWHLGGLLMLTCLAEAVYFLALGMAYRYAPVPLVYPIARSSPVLIAVWTTLLSGDVPPIAGWFGILVSVAGLLWLAVTGRRGMSARALPWAALAAFATSVYSTSNKYAVVDVPGYSAQLGYVSVTFLAAWLVLSWQIKRETGRFRPARVPHTGAWVLGGIFIGNAYALVIHAMQFIPAAYAVAFTNAGIVLAGLVAMVFLREREHWRSRLAAMVTISLGLLLLARG